MSDIPEKVTEKVIDVAADAAGDIAEFSKETEIVIRGLNRIKVQYGLLGMAFGAAAGSVAAFYIAYRRAETKYSKISEEEIAVMREHYREKAVALEAEAAKRPLEDIIKEQGYSPTSERDTPPPMAVQPPLAVVPENDDDEEDEEDEPEVRNVFQDAQVDFHWDWHAERRKRSPDIPYVIHYDERHEMDGYDDMSLTYYEGDDVLANDRDEVIDPNIRDSMVGDKNLDRFGHGSNDAAIVFVRNDKLELIFEIVKTKESYAEAVHGFSHGAWDSRNLERMRARERHAQED